MPTRRALLISGSYFPPQVGGISRQLYRVATTLGTNNVCVLTGVQENGHDVNGVRLRRVPPLFGGTKFVKVASWLRAFPMILAAERPNLVLLGSVDDSNVGIWLHDVMNLPVVLFAYGNEILSTIEGSHDQHLRAFKIANRVVVCSRYSASLAIEAGADENRVSVLHPGCDTDIFWPNPVSAEFRARVLEGRSNQTKIILSVGNLVSRKGHDVVIRALDELRKRVPSLLYVIVGDGPYRATLERLVSEIGVADSVKFTGKISDQELPLYYNLCDVFAMISRAQLEQRDVEGFGIVFLEANSCGKPVIGGRSGGVSDAVHDGVSGLLADPEDPAHVAEVLEELLTNRELAKRLGEQGRARVVEHFSWSRYGESLKAIMNAARDEGPL